MNLRKLLQELEKTNNLNHIKTPISTKYEIAKKLKNTHQATIFENIKKHNLKIIGNTLGTRKRIARGLNTTKNNLIKKMRKALTQPKKPKTITKGPVQEIIEDEVNLRKLPILKHFEKDGGPYVTSSILVAKDSEGNRNLSFHRLQLIDKDKFAARLVPRDLYKMFKEAEEQGESLEVAAILGSSPGLALSAATSPPYEVDEYEIATALSNGLELVECKSVDLKVPAHAEIVLEGKLLAKERASEGPFADITGTYDAVRQQPVFKVNQITRREDSIYQAILPASPEHQLLMGLPREPLIFEEVNKVTNAKNVALTPGGCGWLHGIISIKKEKPEDGKQAIEAAFKAHNSLKHVVVVDENIDIHNSKKVEWCIATRSRADEDVVIKSNVKGSSLDPTADPETRIGSKMGIDATKDLDDSERFEGAEIP